MAHTIKRRTKPPTTHTPGPWKTVKPGHGHATEYLCVQIGADETYTTLEMLPADARLVAASPDLLALAERFLDWAMVGTNPFCYPPGAIEQLVAVMSKAKRRSNP
jgi:hypothetical protein